MFILLTKMHSNEYSFIEVLPLHFFVVASKCKRKHRSAFKTENKTVDTRSANIDF